MPKLQNVAAPARDAEYIDAVQLGLVLRIRRGRMVWFVRYLATLSPSGGEGRVRGWSLVAIASAITLQ